MNRLELIAKTAKAVEAKGKSSGVSHRFDNSEKTKGKGFGTRFDDGLEESRGRGVGIGSFSAYLLECKSCGTKRSRKGGKGAYGDFICSSCRKRG